MQSTNPNDYLDDLFCVDLFFGSSIWTSLDKMSDFRQKSFYVVAKSALYKSRGTTSGQKTNEKIIILQVFSNVQQCCQNHIRRLQRINLGGGISFFIKWCIYSGLAHFNKYFGRHLGQLLISVAVSALTMSSSAIQGFLFS